MSLMVCRDCTCRYAIGLDKCPQCRGTDAIPDWEADALHAVNPGEGFHGASGLTVLRTAAEAGEPPPDDTAPGGKPPLLPPAPPEGEVT
jgi:hypothetical protein